MRACTWPVAGRRGGQAHRGAVPSTRLRPRSPGTPGSRSSGVCRPRLGIAVEPPAGPWRPPVRRPDRGPAPVGLGARHPPGSRAGGVRPARTAGHRRPARNPAHEDKYADTVVASLPLAEHVRLEASRPLRFGFTVPVGPRLPAPTIRMPNFTLSWMLRGVVDRQLHRDPSVAVELQAVTTPQ